MKLKHWILKNSVETELLETGSNASDKNGLLRDRVQFDQGDASRSILSRSNDRI